jgi:hypothetical protein
MGESVLSKLSRCEATIKRQPYRAWQMLARRQAVRRGAVVTPLRVMDLEVSEMTEETGRWEKRFSGRQLCPGKITKQSQTADRSTFLLPVRGKSATSSGSISVGLRSTRSP